MSSMKQMKRWAAAAAYLAVAIVSTAQEKGNALEGKPLVRMVNGEVISRQDFWSYVTGRADLRSLVRNSYGAEEVVREMALTRVLNLEGESLGVVRLNSEVANKRFDDVYGLAVMERQVSTCVRPADEADARRYFDEHPQAFVVPPTARVLRVMLPVKQQIDGKPVMDWFQAQAQAVADGKLGFDDIVARAQADYVLEAQGDLGWIRLEGDNEIVDALRKAKVGNMLGPVRDGEFGYLFLIVNRREQRQLTWNEVKSFAATRAQEHCRNAGQEKVRNELFRRYGVEIDREAIREAMQQASQ
jgi:hypothetical protein